MKRIISETVGLKIAIALIDAVTTSPDAGHIEDAVDVACEWMDQHNNSIPCSIDLIAKVENHFNVSFHE